MKIKFGAIVVDGRNKIGGHVASRNRGGAYLRTKVSPSNPRSTSQVNTRARLSSISSAWKGLTAAQRESWNSAVADYKRTDIFGDIKVPSGFNLFQKLNNNLVLIGETMKTSAPAPVEMPLTTLGSVSAAVLSGTLVFTIQPTTIPTGFVNVVKATPQISAGKSFVKSEFRIIATDVTPAAGTCTITTEYAAKFGAPSQAGSQIFIEYYLVSTSTGQVSQKSQASGIVA